MSLYQMKKDGWLSKEKEEVSLLFDSKDVQRIKDGEKVALLGFGKNKGEEYLCYLKSDALNKKGLNPSDLVILLLGKTK